MDIGYKWLDSAHSAKVFANFSFYKRLGCSYNISNYKQQWGKHF